MIEWMIDDECGRDECVGSSVVENRGVEDVFIFCCVVLFVDCGEIWRDWGMCVDDGEILCVDVEYVFVGYYLKDGVGGVDRV